MVTQVNVGPESHGSADLYTRARPGKGDLCRNMFRSSVVRRSLVPRSSPSDPSWSEEPGPTELWRRGSFCRTVSSSTSGVGGERDVFGGGDGNVEALLPRTSTGREEDGLTGVEKGLQRQRYRVTERFHRDDSRWTRMDWMKYQLEILF